MAPKPGWHPQCRDRPGPLGQRGGGGAAKETEPVGAGFGAAATGSPGSPCPSRLLPALDSVFRARSLTQGALPRTRGVTHPQKQASLLQALSRGPAQMGEEASGWGGRPGACGPPRRAHCEAARRLRPSGSSSPPGRAQGRPGAGGAALQKLTLQHCLAILLRSHGSDIHS